MERYPANATAARTHKWTFDASDPAYPIPTWAQNGKSYLKVTGGGAGASGSIETSSSGIGAGGGAGAIAEGFVMRIPAGIATLAASIGLGGSPVTANAETKGNVGGSTSVAIGAVTFVLPGGNAGANAASFVPAMLNPAGVAQGLNTGAQIGGLPNCYQGAPGGNPGSGAGSGAGGPSPFGVAGNGLTTVSPAVNVQGVNASGRCAGGSGAMYYSGAPVTSGRGADGWLTIEIVEVP